MNPEKLKKLQAAKAAGAQRSTGAPRRKKKIVHSSAGNDARKFQTQLQKNNVNAVSGVDEVNMFKNDDTILHFANPKVQQSQEANTTVVSGKGEIKQMQELIPGIVQQMGPDNMDMLKRIAEQMQQQSNLNLGAMGGAAAAAANEDDDDEVPELVENFDDAANVD